MHSTEHTAQFLRTYSYICRQCFRFIYLCYMFVCGRDSIMVHMWRSENCLCEMVLSFHLRGQAWWKVSLPTDSFSVCSGGGDSDCNGMRLLSETGA